MPTPYASTAVVDFDFVGVASPAVLPPGVGQFSCQVSDVVWDRALQSDFASPAALRDATEARQWQFRAGRLCALKALRALEPHGAFRSMPRSASGAPIWPAGFTGSITHSGGLVSAAAARTREFAAVGIDTARVMSPEQARTVSLSAAWASEIVEARRAGCNPLEALTLVYSAKESIFKCLAGIVGRLDFRDLRIVDVDQIAGTFTARLVRTLSVEFRAQTLLVGRFLIDKRRIHTGIALEADA